MDLLGLGRYDADERERADFLLVLGLWKIGRFIYEAAWVD